MIRHVEISDKALYNILRGGEVLFAGNTALKIYGRLNCKSGKRMKKENRVFFMSEQEALLSGFRPCGHCLREKYKNWK
jgi:methylphosphotriester-DNA--protein-cysteine methyltransferase